MPHLSQIVCALNEGLKKQSLGIVNGEFHGLAELIALPERATVPALVDVKGEAAYIGLDDRKPFIVYHRVESVSTQPTKLGYGNAEYEREIAKLRLVVWYPKKDNEQSIEQTLSRIASMLPRALSTDKRKELKLHSCKITPGEHLTNNRVCQDEYSKPMQDSRFCIGALTYTVEQVYTPDCIRECAC